MERCRRRIKETEERVFLKKGWCSQQTLSLRLCIYLWEPERTLLLPRKCLKACVCWCTYTHNVHAWSSVCWMSECVCARMCVHWCKQPSATDLPWDLTVVKWKLSFLCVHFRAMYVCTTSTYLCTVPHGQMYILNVLYGDIEASRFKINTK